MMPDFAAVNLPCIRVLIKSQSRLKLEEGSNLMQSFLLGLTRRVDFSTSHFSVPVAFI